MVGTGENIKTGPKSDARIRTLWEALAKKSQNQRSRFCQVPERGGKAASQMGSRLPDDFPLSKYNLWCVWHSLCLLLISLSFQIKFHVRCLYLHFCELKPVVKWMYPQGGCSTKPSCSIGHITSCYHLCLFENHPLCTHWIPLMVFFGRTICLHRWWMLMDHGFQQRFLGFRSDACLLDDRIGRAGRLEHRYGKNRCRIKERFHIMFWI